MGSSQDILANVMQIALKQIHESHVFILSWMMDELYFQFLWSLGTYLYLFVLIKVLFKQLSLKITKAGLFDYC